MEVIDISLELSNETPTYRGRKEKKPSITVVRTLEEGANEMRLNLETHTGTHVDAPLHMLHNATSIDQIPLTHFMGFAYLAEIRNVPVITEKELLPFEPFLSRETFLLIKTDNSFQDLNRDDFVYLDRSAAQFLSERNPKGVGIDALGIERNQPDHATHQTLLSRGILIFEGLYLKEVNPGWYYFMAFPLKVKAGDGAPARAVLMRI
ncbi:MAG: cyclase family protein [Candidatus Atribacteria bacterium]|nr:cyclase family protein [Candidatus Atribacteria bacterium]